MTGPGNLLMHRAHADDLARRARYLRNDAASQEFANRGAGAQELAGEVDTKYRVPVLQGHVLEGRITLQPGIGNEYVDGAELRAHVGEHIANLRF